MNESEVNQKTNIETNLANILNKWKFPQNIIDKYKSLGISDVFQWQAECLSKNSNIGKLNF